MTEQEFLKYGEIQYLKGRLDELFKTSPQTLDLHDSRVLDQRIEKYLKKLKSVDEISFECFILFYKLWIFAYDAGNFTYKSNNKTR